jgi:hypothetical protein
MKLRTSLLAAVALTATIVLTPTVALAQVRERAPERTADQSARMDRVKTRCLAAIDRRQRALGELNDRIDKRDKLPAEHAAALKDINDKTSRGLAALANTIQGEDNAEELRAECRSIVDDYRVFALVLPRARLVMTSDRELGAVERLRDAADRIQAAIDEAKSEGKDTSQAEAHVATMRSEIDSAASHAGAVYEEVIHVTPQTWSEGVLDPAREDVRAARDAIRTAAEEGHAAVKALRESSASEA